MPGLDSEGNRLAGHRSTLADYDRSLPALSPALPEQVRKLDTMTTEVRPGEEGEGAAALPERFDSPEQFVQTLLPIARRVAADSGIDPRLMVAQAALETGWGRYMIEGDDARPSFNLFGIKADDRWSGDSVTLTTTEFRGGRPMKERADFRAYPTTRPASVTTSISWRPTPDTGTYWRWLTSPPNSRTGCRPPVTPRIRTMATKSIASWPGLH